MVKVTPQPIYETESEFAKDKDEMARTVSVRFCLSTMVVFSILCSVCVMTVIWIVFFSASINTLSNNVLELQQNKLVSYIDNTLQQFVISSESVKRQTLNFLSNVSDFSMVERIAFSYFKSEYALHPSLINSASLRSNLNRGVVFSLSSGAIVKLVYTTDTKIYLCAKFDTSCVGPVAPILIMPFFNYTTVYETKIGKPSFSKVSQNQGTIFIALDNLNSNPSSPNGFDWFIQTSFRAIQISQFLKNATVDTVQNSLGFIIESSTNYIVATCFPELMTYQTSLTTGATFNNTLIKTIYYLLKDSFPQYQSMPCNSLTVLSQDYYKISVYRYCNAYNVDWIVVFAVPEWNYIGNMIIAIVSAIGCGILVVVLGGLLGIYFSTRVVKPFKNLITLFESVSRMELDIEVKGSKFREVSQLQHHFKLMVERMKQYRAFIPAHLLSQLEGMESNTEEVQSKTHSNGKGDSNSNLETVSSKLSSSMVSHRKRPPNSLFKLGIEKKSISFCMIYLDGFETWLENIDNDIIVSLLTEMFEVVQKLSQSTTAQVGQFESQQIFLSWNSTAETKDHERKALISGAQLWERLEQVRKKWSQHEIFMGENAKLFNSFNFVIAIHKQHSKCGNFLGSNSAKSFTILGSANHNLLQLVKHATKLQVPVIASEKLLSNNSTHLSRFIGKRRLLSDHKIQSSVSKQKNGEKTKLFQIGESLNGNMDEWMYELQESERKGKWDLFNSATNHFLENNFKDSLALLKDYELKHLDDLPTKYLIEKCNKQL